MGVLIVLCRCSTFHHVKNKMHALLHHYTSQSCLFERSGDMSNSTMVTKLCIVCVPRLYRATTQKAKTLTVADRASPEKDTENPYLDFTKKDSKGLSVCEKQTYQVWLK